MALRGVHHFLKIILDLGWGTPMARLLILQVGLYWFTFQIWGDFFLGGGSEF